MKRKIVVDSERLSQQIEFEKISQLDKSKENLSYHAGILWEEAVGDGWSAASEPSMTTIRTKVRCENHRELRGSQLEHSLSGSKLPGELLTLSTHTRRIFTWIRPTDQCQKMTNFKLTLPSLFLKQINHYNNIYRRVSELIRCREIKVWRFSLSSLFHTNLIPTSGGRWPEPENNSRVLRFNQSFGRSQVTS